MIFLEWKWVYIDVFIYRYVYKHHIYFLIQLYHTNDLKYMAGTDTVSPFPCQTTASFDHRPRTKFSRTRTKFSKEGLCVLTPWSHEQGLPQHLTVLCLVRAVMPYTPPWGRGGTDSTSAALSVESQQCLLLHTIHKGLPSYRFHSPGPTPGAWDFTEKEGSFFTNSSSAVKTHRPITAFTTCEMDKQDLSCPEQACSPVSFSLTPL